MSDEFHHDPPLHDPVELAERFAGEGGTIFLDYDGTLVPIMDRREEANLTSSLRELLARFAAQSAWQIIVVSGRDKDFLSRQLTDLPFECAAEHGALYRPVNTENFFSPNGLTMSHRERIESRLDDWLKKFPGAEIESKEFSLVFHYRLASPRPTVFELLTIQKSILEDLAGTHCLPGKDILEFRATAAGKGEFLRWRLQDDDNRRGTILAIGDDVTDEALFLAAKAFGGTSIKVGEGHSTADFRLRNVESVGAFLKALLDLRKS